MTDQFNMGGYKNLSAAVVEKAVNDYRLALIRLKRKPSDIYANKMKTDCERFFKNEIGMYSNLDGESIIRIINERLEKET